MKKIIFTAMAVFLAMCWYFAMPTLAWDFPLSLLVTWLVPSFFLFFFLEKRIKSLDLVLFLTGTTGLAWMAIFVIVFSGPIFYSTEYRDILGKVEESDFTQEISPIDIDQIRIVDAQMAQKMGEKRLGEDPALGSRATLGDFNIQSVNGQLYWVAPILHSGFFKWKKFGYTPGYVKVSATNPRDVELVTQVAGKDLRIKYQPNAYFGDNLTRKLYFNGYMTVGLTDYSFEIDDTGKPFYVVTLYDKEVGFSGNNATGVAVVDVETGEIQKYTPENAPAWIDRIQPERFIISQIDDWGSYVNGWINSWTSREGMLQSTPGMSLVYSNSESYWYTGISSVGSDESTVGFMLVNTRSKSVHWYKQAGATETAAMQSAEGKVQEKGYVASFPILYNIAGVPTYVMSLKDNSGLIKMIAMVSVEDYSIVGVGDTVRTSLRAYRSALVSRGNSIVPGSGSEFETVNGKVSRFAVDIRSGESYYSFILGENPNQIFTGNSGLSSELPLTQVGDSVLIGFTQAGTAVIDITSFDNLEIAPKESATQEAADQKWDAVEKKKTDKKVEKSADASWDKLSPEEKAKLLKKVE